MDAFEISPRKSKLGPWVVGLGAEVVRFESIASGESIVVPRAEVAERLEWIPLLGKRSLLVLHPATGGAQGSRGVEFQLAGAPRAKFAEWLGPPSQLELRAMLKRRYAMALPLALALVISALPLPVAGPGAQFAALSFFLGVGLAFTWGLSKLWPHRALFLVDALWFMGLGGGFVWRVVTGRSSPYLLLWLPFGLVLAATGCVQFQRFALPSPSQEKKGIVSHIKSSPREDPTRD